MAPPARKRSGIPVRGSCSRGHITEGVSNPGRITAEFTCSHDGCGEPVKAKRIPKDATPPAPDAADDDGGTRVIRIDDYDATADGTQDDAGGLVVADLEPAATVASEPAGDEGPDDPLSEHGGRAGWWERRRRRAATRSARRAARPYGHPLGI